MASNMHPDKGTYNVAKTKSDLLAASKRTVICTRNVVVEGCRGKKEKTGRWQRERREDWPRITKLLRGLPLMMPTKFSGFLTTSALVCIWNWFILEISCSIPHYVHFKTCMSIQCSDTISRAHMSAIRDETTNYCDTFALNDRHIYQYPTAVAPYLSRPSWCIANCNAFRWPPLGLFLKWTHTV